MLQHRQADLVRCRSRFHASLRGAGWQCSWLLNTSPCPALGLRRRRAADVLPQALEFLVIGERDYQFAFAFGVVREFHPHAQGGAELLLQGGDVGALAGTRRGCGLGASVAARVDD